MRKMNERNNAPPIVGTEDQYGPRILDPRVDAGYTKQQADNLRHIKGFWRQYVTKLEVM